MINNADIHESIYTFIYMMPRAICTRNCAVCVRRRKTKQGLSGERRGKIPDMVSIDERP